MIDHDRLFKELLSTFFLEFLELFLPEMLDYIEPETVTFLDKEVFTDVTAGDRFETDLLAQVQFRGNPSFFLIHVENQASAQPAFGKRMFRYFARLFEKHDYPVYPIVVFSYEQPSISALNEFRIDFPDFLVLSFNYRVIQLNRFNWRDFLTKQNPIASALMAKMNIAPEDRPKVKANCLRLLVTLKLDPARMQLISGFIDTYLQLTPEEETTFNIEIGRAEPEEQEEIMEIVTSWMRKGIEQGLEQGLEQGRREGELKFLLRLLTNTLGPLPLDVELRLRGLSETQLEALGDRLPTLTSIETLIGWLNDATTSEETAD